MIVSRQAQSTESTRNTSRAPRDHSDEPLRMQVRALARQAARERFEREMQRNERHNPR